MGDPGVFGVFRRTACFLERFHPIARTGDGHDIVLVAVKDPEGCIPHQGNLGRITGASDWNGGDEMPRMPGKQIPGCESRHGQAHDINPIRVQGKLQGERIQELHHLGQDGPDGNFIHGLVIVHPGVGAWALGRDYHAQINRSIFPLLE